MIDDWPNDEEMAEMCGCDHPLGQHAYGDDLAPCDECRCRDFHDPHSCAHRQQIMGCPNDSKPPTVLGGANR